MRHIPRFYCPDQSLQTGAVVALNETAAHHARTVLRLREGDALRLFNPADGEWQGAIHYPDKRTVTVALDTCLKTSEALPDIWLVLAALKNKDAFDNAIRHAVELGVTKILLVQTEHTQIAKINMDRLQQQIIDAAQQCGRLSVPECQPLQTLKTCLAHWPTDRILYAAVEGADLPRITPTTQPRAILIGPEGGFSDAEKAALTSGKPAFVQPITLGSLILRSDTAVASGLTII